MKEILHQLIQLRELDASIHELRDQLHLYPGMLKELDAKEKKAQREIDSVRQRFRESREGRRQAELDADGLREKIRKYKIQQGNVKTNRELEAINHEIETLEGRIEELDTFGLESLEKEERSQEELAHAEDSKKRLIEESDRERSRIAEQTESKRLRLVKLQEEQARRTARLPEDIRDLYELLNEKYPGAAIVPVKDGACSGCSMNLVRQRVTEVRRADQPVRCDNCTRLLYDPGYLEGRETVAVGDH